ncbi:MAG TPA: hypothetical protein VGC22_14140 [Chitinophaga sp.]
MDTFTLDFDLEGKGYIVVVTPQATQDGVIYQARLDEDTDIRFLGGAAGTLLPTDATGTDPRLVQAIATRILEWVHAEERKDTDTPSVP